VKKVAIGVTAGVLLIGGALVAVWHFGYRNVEELAETATADPVQSQRSDLTPIRGEERMLFFCLDGVGYEALGRALTEGQMPRLAAALGDPRGEDGTYAEAFSAPRVLSILPSTTVAAWTSVFTGVGVAEHGISGNEQFHRESGHFLAPAPVSVPDVAHMMNVFNGAFLGEFIEAETLYEKLPDLRHHVSLAHVHRGADVFSMPTGVEAGSIFGAFVEGLGDDSDSGARLEGSRALDRQSIDALLSAVDEHGLPDLQVIYFPGIDLYTHVSENALEEQRRFLAEVTDPAMGRVFDRWEREGALDDTWIVVTADHGHTPVIDDDRHSLSPAPEEDDEPSAVLTELGFTMRPLVIDQAEGPYSAALAYQGALAYVHLADRSSCTEEACDWSRPPRLEQDVLPVARAFFEANDEGPLAGSLDLIFAREGRPTDRDALPFQVFDGERLVPVGEYLAANPRPELLRLEARLEALAAGPYGHRAGDVMLLSRSGAELALEERFYFSALYRSWHGSPRASDSHVPLVVARRGSDGAAIRRRVERGLGPTEPDESGTRWHSQRGITPLIVSLLSGEPSR